MTTIDQTSVLTRHNAAFRSVDLKTRDGNPILEIKGAAFLSSYAICGTRIREEGTARIIEVYVAEADGSDDGTVNFLVTVPLSDDITSVSFANEDHVIWTKSEGITAEYARYQSA